MLIKTSKVLAMNRYLLDDIDGVTTGLEVSKKIQLYSEVSLFCQSDLMKSHIIGFA